MVNKIISFFHLIRLSNPTGIVLLYIPCAFGILLGSDLDHFPLYNLFIFFLGSVLMRSAGCIINDLWDMEIDGQVARTKNRPLVTGSVSLKEACIYLIILLGFSSLILFSLPILAIKLVFFSFVLVIIYPSMKRITFFPQIFLGITYNMGLIIGYITANDSFNPSILIAYLGFIFWTLSYDTIYAFSDIKDDKKIGVRSLAIILEHRKYKSYLYFFGFAFILLCLFSEILIKPSYLIFMNFIPALLTWRLIDHFIIDDTEYCILCFKMNGALGFLILAPLVAQFFLK